jgi:predicted amidohydrolase YtcJ
MRKLGLLLLLCSQYVFGQEETIYYNGNIFTANPLQPFAEAVTIRGQKIVAVGNFSEVINTVSHHATKIDLKGACLLPGLIDSHIHAIEGGVSLTRANVFDELLTTTQLVDYVRKSLLTKQGMTAGILPVYGLNIATWLKIDELSAAFNAAEFAQQPIWLKGSDGHTAWVNTAMMEKAGLNKQYILTLSPDQRLYFGITKQDEPNGFVVDSGLHKIYSVVPEGNIDYHLAATKAIYYCNSHGITAWLDPSAAYTNEKEAPFLDAYQWLARENKLTAHIAATIVADADGKVQEQINMVKALQKKYGVNRNISIIGFKIFADGVIEYPTQTAAISKPYTNRSSSGVLMYNPKNFARFAILADKQKLLVHVHAIGDLAVTETLNGFEAVRKANGNSGLPHTITHMQIVLPGDFDRFQQLNVLASLQLLWAYGDITTIDIVKPYISPELYKYQYPARSLLNAGCTICGASDWPVSSANPFEAMAKAETRKGPMGVLDSTQCMPRMAMLYAYTSNAAKALLKETTIGSIQPGKFADLVMVDRDVMMVNAEALNYTKVVWTMFEGKIIYRANP